MKKTTIFFRLTLLLLLAIVVCCTQESIEDQLPPITQTGANTFAFVYDGVVFTPTGSNSRGFGIDGSGDSGLAFRRGFITAEGSNSVKIQADRYTNIKNVLFIYIYIYKLDSIGIGTYPLGTYTVRNGFYEPYNSYIVLYAKSPSTGERVGYSSWDNSGEIIITRKDEDHSIYSGTFSGKLRNETETIEISQGRFDINYDTYRDKEYK